MFVSRAVAKSHVILPGRLALARVHGKAHRHSDMKGGFIYHVGHGEEHAAKPIVVLLGWLLSKPVRNILIVC